VQESRWTVIVVVDGFTFQAIAVPARAAFSRAPWYIVWRSTGFMKVRY
jgi:hypothetical protein